jgi:antitoxin ParD1/3/4
MAANSSLCFCCHAYPKSLGIGTRPARGCLTRTRIGGHNRFTKRRHSIRVLLVLAIFANRGTVSPQSGIHEKDQVMPTRNVNLTDELDRFVAKKVKTGRYENASEVVRAGLRTLEREEQQYEAKIAALRAAIDAGDASGIAEGNVFGRVRKALKLPVSRR